MLNARPVPIVEQLVIARAGFQLERLAGPEGPIVDLHFDVLIGEAARRYTVRFDEQGFDHFRSAVAANSAGLTLARALPSIGELPA